MLDLLATGHHAVASKTEPARVAPPKSIFALATRPARRGAVLIWLIAAGPGFLGYGASLLWAGLPRAGASFLRYSRAAGQQAGAAQIGSGDHRAAEGFAGPAGASVGDYKSASKWEEAPMVPRAGGSGYEFLFAALPEPVEYYVEASGVRSQDLQAGCRGSARDQARSRLHIISRRGLGCRTLVEDPGGDLRAP